MQNNSANAVTKAQQSRLPTGLVRFSAFVIIMLIGGFFVWQLWSNQQPAQTDSGVETLSATAFEKRTGLRLRLLAVTAGGGMVDLRLKITEPDKARAFLEDTAHLPRLVAAESGESLIGVEELGDDIDWNEGGILFVLFSNNSGAIKSGTPVTVNFGEVQLEPVPAQ